jgi:transposase-like protein
MLKYSRLSAYKVNGIILCFCEDINASSASKLLRINRNTINLYYNHFRRLIFQQSFEANSRDFGVFELDESYFGARRVKGKRGRGAAGKIPVFGLLKRGGKAFVSIIPNCSKEELMPIIQGKILEGSEIHTDGWSAYNGLILIFLIL